MSETGGIKRKRLLKVDVHVVLNTREIHSSTDEWISVRKNLRFFAHEKHSFSLCPENFK